MSVIERVHTATAAHTHVDTAEHLDTTPHHLVTNTPHVVTVDGGLDAPDGYVITAVPCECGRWIEIPEYDY